MEIIVYYRARSSEADGIMRLMFEVSPARAANSNAGSPLVD